MSPRLLAMALAPLLGLFIIALGNGFMSSLTTLRLGAAGESATTIGIVSSTYSSASHWAPSSTTG